MRTSAKPSASAWSLIDRVRAFGSAAATIGSDSLVGQPQRGRRSAGLPEHVDRNAAARIPIAADAQPGRIHRRDQALADRDGAILVEGAVIAEAGQEQLQGFA